MASFTVTSMSNEPVNGLGDGDMAPDVVITGTGLQPRVIQLRRERSGLGNGRIYTISASALDQAGNRTTATGTCRVPLALGEGSSQ